MQKGKSIITDAERVKEKMNSAALHSSPFLFAVDFEINNGIFISDPLNSDELLFRVGNYSNIKHSEVVDDRAYFHVEELLKIKEVLTEEEYKRKFLKVFAGLKRGDSYLTNLTCKTKVELNIAFEAIIQHSQTPYALCVPDYFVCFTPERFVRIENGVISCSPMKGTIDASLKNALATIMDDYKESCEHNTITDLIRNDIGIVSNRVWVERFRYAETISTDRGDIIQISSDIRGQLTDGYKNRMGDIIFTLLPAGSVSGAPKKSTLKIIAEAEGEKRGFYTGVFGYYDGEVLDSAVLIRFIEKRDGDYYYRSGGGVTVNSKQEEEYREMIQKIYLPFKKI